MKSIKNIVFPLIMLIGAQSAMAMQLPSYLSAAIKKEPASLPGMPADVKRHLIAIIAQGDQETAAESIFSLAQTNKEFNTLVNQLNPDFVIALLDGISDVPKAIKLVEKMQAADARLPTLSNEAIEAWLVEARESLVNHHARLVREHRIEAGMKLGLAAAGLGIAMYSLEKLTDYAVLVSDKVYDATRSRTAQWSIGLTLTACGGMASSAIGAMPFVTYHYIKNRLNRY